MEVEYHQALDMAIGLPFRREHGLGARLGGNSALSRFLFYELGRVISFSHSLNFPYVKKKTNGTHFVEIL